MPKLTEQEDAEAAIQDMRDADIAATKAFDVDALAGLWTEDVVAISPGREPVVGKAANLAALRKFKAQSRGITAVEYTQDWRDLQIAGDHAFEWGQFSSVARVANGSLVTECHNVLRVLRREEGRWKIARTAWNASAPRN